MFYKENNKIYEIAFIRDIYPEEAALPYYVCPSGSPIPDGYVALKKIRRYSNDGFVYLYPVGDNEDGDFLVCMHEDDVEKQENFEEWLEHYERALNGALYEYTIKQYSLQSGIWVLEGETKSIDIPPGCPVEVHKIEVLIEK